MVAKVSAFPTRGYTEDREGIAALLEKVASRIRSGEVDAELCILITNQRGLDDPLLVDVFGGRVTNAEVVGLLEYGKLKYVLE